MYYVSSQKKHMKNLIVTVTLFTFSLPLFAQQKEFSWLIGTWKLKDKNIFEQWMKDPDGKSLIGKSFRVKGADTVSMEEVRFTFSNNQFHYIPDVAGEQGPVDFAITKYEANSFVAENPLHDFPKIIRYKRVKKDDSETIEASIEGGSKVISYQYQRVK
jgi:hypothetical protein